MQRREFLRRSAVGVTSLVMGGKRVVAAERPMAEPGDSPYGPLLDPDSNGVRLPAGFRSRIVAHSGEQVADTGYVWHQLPDGGETFPLNDGGWIYVSNSEARSAGAGGVGAIRFAADGSIVDAYPILRDTSMNCSGGKTPWDTWLSCEEHERGQVWECNPFEESQGEVRPAMGIFTHEAAVVDPRPDQQRIYLTEDDSEGGFYRFTPTSWPDLSAGLLEVAVVEDDEGGDADEAGSVRWVEVPDPQARDVPTRRQVREMTQFKGGEGIDFDGECVIFATKDDDRVWCYDPAAQRVEVLYRADDHDDPPLRGVDNVRIGPSGDVYIAEDGDDMQVVLITADGAVAPFLQLTGIAGLEHRGSEVSGPAFSPAGDRFYCSSQRAGGDPTEDASGIGVTFEVTGPFLNTTGPNPRASESVIAMSERASAPPQPGKTPTADATGTASTPDGDRGPGGLLGVLATIAAAAVGALLWVRRRRDGEAD